MGAALMRSFAFIRFDFPARQVRFSSHATFRPAAAAAVRACLPMRDWKGRPAVEGSLGGHPLLLVIDTAGDFDLALPPATANLAGPLTLGDWSVDDIQPAAHAALGLPEAFPARLGLGVLSRAAVTLDHKNRRVWFEHPLPPETDPSAPAADEEDETPVHYRGIIR